MAFGYGWQRIWQPVGLRLAGCAGRCLLPLRGQRRTGPASRFSLLTRAPDTKKRRHYRGPGACGQTKTAASISAEGSGLHGPENRTDFFGCKKRFWRQASDFVIFRKPCPCYATSNWSKFQSSWFAGRSESGVSLYSYRFVAGFRPAQATKSLLSCQRGRITGATQKCRYFCTSSVF